tara:strand:- start:584 stop:865 length:282 start_codon:yes stop_codon:yes gene_type:complete
MFNDFPEAIAWCTAKQAREECERIKTQYIEENHLGDDQTRLLYVRPYEVPVLTVDARATNEGETLQAEVEALRAEVKDLKEDNELLLEYLAHS